MKRVNTFTPMESDVDRTVPKIAAESTKRVAEEELVHHVSTKDGIDIYMLVKREYPLSRGVLTHMLVAKLLVEQDNEISRELLRKIFIQIERPRR
ncbi:hypothetical protein Tco_0728508 [Tanacetum coccineum]|uniref:Uncharacterized protein n=1 Tax=Tanacetum coccineum TaxID=301880 RepID=A0ABQ4YP04_9ASTR